MEEIREAALTYYENGSEEHKQLARDFFNSLDADGDGTVDVHEFINILREEIDGSVDYSRLFQELDRDGNGSLDFNEFLTLFYIIKSRSRPFCNGCRILLKGLFFTCVKCHESSNNTFDLCSACYRGKRFSHQHAAFLDNYTLLAHKRLIALGGEGQLNSCQTTSRSSSFPRGMSERAKMFPHIIDLGVKKQRHWLNKERVQEAFEAFDTGFTIGTSAVYAATVCSIM